MGVWAASPPGTPANQQLRLDVRDALEAQRAAGQAAERREEAAAGRRLTEPERARLREQLRREWAAYAEAEASRADAPGTAPGAAGAGAAAGTTGELRQSEAGADAGTRGLNH